MTNRGYEERAVGGVRVVHWNPRRRLVARGPLRRLSSPRRVNNFGDLLGPHIVRWAASRRGVGKSHAADSTRLLSIGSILHFAQDNDVVWGTGRNGKIEDTEHRFRELRVRAIRGPLTAEFLQKRGIASPAIFGDPGLLTPLAFPDLANTPKVHDLTIVPNLNDLASATQDHGRGQVLDPRSPLRSCLRRIAASRTVVGSSLHGVIVAEALGIPASFIRSTTEQEFKYQDYLAGTGRYDVKIAQSVREARELAGQDPLGSWNPDGLLGSFPVDLWETA